MRQSEEERFDFWRASQIIVSRWYCNSLGVNKDFRIYEIN
jgi:hypothetical protein